MKEIKNNKDDNNRQNKGNNLLKKKLKEKIILEYDKKTHDKLINMNYEKVMEYDEIRFF